MSYVVTPFEVSSKAASEPAQVRFMHLFPGVATRHSDTVDCVFRVNGQKVMVAISSAAINELRERTYLTDQQLAEIAALFLRRTLEQGYDPTEAELFIERETLRVLGRELGYSP